MLVLFETAAGYAIFKLLDEKKLKKTENLYLDFQTPELASNVVQLKHFKKFHDTTEALSAATASVEGKMSKHLKKIMKKLVSSEAQETLAVADAKLGNAIKSKYNLDCVSNSAVHELMRGIRSQMDSLITGLPQKEMSAMALGLAHSLSRYKLKFSPDKVDTMIVQAIALLDDLDKELNNYIMRAREWYGWHFPELTKIVTDNIAFAKVVKLIGDRTNSSITDMSSVLPEEVEKQVKEAAEISMGTEVSEEDIINILHLCDEIVEISQYRTQLFDYLKNRMMAIAPNLTLLVGELVGARLIAHAGSLLNLAKHPASTVQILGAEKALFRALKTKHDTPKYGLIYHASLVGQCSQAFKGKMSRKVAAKSSLAARVDALGEETNIELGMNQRAKLEMALKRLEDGQTGRISGLGKQQAKFDKYQNKSQVKLYDSAMDSTLPLLGKKRKRDDSELVDTPEVKPKKSRIEVIEPVGPGGDADRGAGSAKKKIKVEEKDTTFDTSHGSTGDGDVSISKKKKKRIKSENGDSTFNKSHNATLDTTHDSDEVDTSVKKKKKKKQKADDSSVSLEASFSSSRDIKEESIGDTPSEKKKKKKKRTTE